MFEQLDTLKSRSWAWFDARAHGPHAIFWLALLAFLEPIISPIVPETLMVAMLLSKGEHWRRYAGITSAFSFLGGIAGYAIGYFLFAGIGQWLLSFDGSEAWLARASALIAGNIFLVMLVVTFTPVPDKVFVILAGFLRAPLFPYAAGFLIGRMLRFYLVAYLTHRFGPHIITLVNRYSNVLAVLVVAVLAYFALAHFDIFGL